jgi:TfoX/Sxy family transcriptional regulator of competence genes
MARWQRSSPELVARFQAALPDDPRVERRSMFGYPAAFVGGNLFAGLHEERCLLRLGDAQRAALLAEPGAHPFEPMPGRAMREYVVVPPRLVAERGALVQWLAEAFRHARTLPPKAKRPAIRAPKTTAKTAAAAREAPAAGRGSEAAAARGRGVRRPKPRRG